MGKVFGIQKNNIYFLIILFLFLWFIWNNPDISFLLFASVVLACSINPLVDKLGKKMNRAFATSIVIFGIIIIFFVLIIPVLVLGFHQIEGFIKALPSYIANLDNMIKNFPILKNFGIEQIDLNLITSTITNFSSEIINKIFNFSKSIGAAFLYIFTAIIFVFFMLTDKNLIKKNALSLFPKEMRKRAGEIADNIGQKIGGYVIAQIVSSMSVWIIITVGLLLCKTDYAIFLGLISGILDIIPIIGPTMALIICLVATYEMGIKTTIIVVCIFALAQFIENNIIRPYAYNKLLNIHPIIVFLSLFIGAKYGGTLGVLFAPPVATALIVLVDELYIKRMEN